MKKIRSIALAICAAGLGSGPAQAQEVTVAAVGHIVMGTVFPLDRPMLPPDGGRTIFSATRDQLRQADFTFGNLAAPLSDLGTTSKDPGKPGVFAFRTPPSYVENLKDAGFDVVQAANNHILDFGQEAYLDTLRHLERSGIGHVGRKDELYVKEVRGIRVGLLGFTQPYVSAFATHHDIPAAAAAVARARARVDVLLVSFHGGSEGSHSLHTPRAKEYLGSEYRGEVVRMARALVDSGADLVVGYGPHLPRAMELYKGKLINYSLGNFATYGPFNLKGPNGLSLILKASFDKSGRMLRALVLPLKVPKPGIPEPDPQGETIAHLNWLSAVDFPESAPKLTPAGELILPASCAVNGRASAIGSVACAGGAK